MNPAEANEIVKKIAARFKILEDWDIQYLDELRDGWNCCSEWFPEQKKGIIYRCDCTEDQHKYVLHEVLHGVLRAIPTIPAKQSRCDVDGDEMVVRDLTDILKPVLFP
jgi:hypothetical protein